MLFAEWDLHNADPGTVENVGRGEKDEDESQELMKMMKMTKDEGG